MLKTEVSSIRAGLGFPEAVTSAFNFLVKDYSFRCVERDVTFVRFESKYTFLNVYHGRLSFELNVEIGELKSGEGDPEVPFTIGEILYSVKAPEAANYRPYQVHTIDLVTKFVNELAVLVKQYAVAGLIGDHVFFQQVAKDQADRSDEYLKVITFSRTRSEAEAAWHQKDFSRVVNLYNSMLENLTPAEAKRLAYAKKNVLTSLVPTKSAT
jgi:hypothetical protein